MRDAIYAFPDPANEPVKTYLKGSPEREALEKELKRQSSIEIEIPLIIGGKEVRTGNTGKVVMPHDHHHVLATYHKAGPKEVRMAIDAAMAAHKQWSETDWTIRASILMKAAELISTKYRALMNAATMLGQSKNLNMSPVLMGNVTVWKPSTTAILSNYYLMQIYKEAGLPDGVVNFIPGKGSVIGAEIFASKHLAGVHFTGSSATFNTLWKQVGDNIDNYRTYPRLVGETGGKDFIFVTPTAVAEDVATAAFCGAFEFQGQKCSAASRMYIPKSLWPKVLEGMKAFAAEAKMGDVCDPDNFINAVIDEVSFDNIAANIEYARKSPDAEIVIGGGCDKTKGYFVEPTVIVTTDPHFKTIEEEIFGPVLTVYVYEDADMDAAVELCDTTSPYGLTGAVFGQDRLMVQRVADKLRYAAGNFYINDKPTGAVVGLQPFGGSRKSGTNDKAGGEFNLIRWAIPRAIKETLVPARGYKYPYMK